MKKTIFEGTVNGEKFDNVAAYNAKLQELIGAGVEDITATSSTNIKVDNNTTDKYVTTPDPRYNDEDLSVFPYMCEDDPFYLDLLVTDDPVTNQEAYDEAQKILDKCYIYTHSVMDECCNCERKAYLKDVEEIIKNVKKDISDTISAIDKVNAKKKKAEEAYHAEINKLNKELDFLKAADKVSSMFKAYYEDVQNEMLTMIEEDKNKNCNCNKNKDKENDIETSCTQTKDQIVSDLNSLIDRIFGDVGIYRR